MQRKRADKEVLLLNQFGGWAKAKVERKDELRRDALVCVSIII
ncbi:MAG: hypothetical protein ACP5E9_07675 [Candidatus Methanospirareceae archaeon]